MEAGAVLLLVTSLANCVVARSYLNEFAVLVPAGEKTADVLAQKYGFRNAGQIGDLDNYFLFEHRSLSRRSANASNHHQNLLTEDPEVEWFEQQKELHRVKRDYKEATNKNTNLGGVNGGGVYVNFTSRSCYL